MNEEILEGLGEVFFALQKHTLETNKLPEDSLIAEVLDDTLGITLDEFTVLRQSMSDSDKIALSTIINNKINKETT